jgi:hypothetical protein
MPHPYVTKVTFNDGQLVLTVELDEYLAAESVEISGYATQNSGGFATFNDIQIATKIPDGTVVMYVTATPSEQFKSGEDITVSARASRVWVTVLTESPDGDIPNYHPMSPSGGTTAQEGTAWNSVTAVGWAAPAPLSSSSAGKTSAGSDSNFQNK